MGTKVHFESYFPGYHPMQNLSEDSNVGSWPLFSGDKNLANGQYYDGFLPKRGGGGSAYQKDVVKQKMLEHDAIFRSQVYELHRLYKIQRDLIDDIRRNELQTYIPGEPSVSSSPLGLQLPFQEVKKWHNPSLSLVNTISARPPVSSAEDSYSHWSTIENKSFQVGLAVSQNGSKSMDCEILGSRPTKVRRKMFDLQLPGDQYIDTDKVEKSGNKTVAESDDVNVFDASLRNRIGLADLNEPFKVEANTSGSLDIQGNGPFKFLPNGTSQKLTLGRDIVMPNNPQTENKGSGREWKSHMFEAGRPENNLRFDIQGFQPEKLPVNSQSLQAMLDKAPVHQTLYPTDPNKEDFWRNGTVPTSSFSKRNNDHSQAYQYGSSCDPAKSWYNSIPSWDKPISSINQQAMLVESHPCFGLSPRLSSYHSSVQNHGVFEEKLHFNRNSPSNSGFRSDAQNINGFYPGSSSGSKGHLTSTGFDNLNYSNGCNIVTNEQIKRTSTHYFNASNHIDLNSVNHIKMDLMLSSHNSYQLSNKIESGNGQGFTQNITSASCSGNIQSNGVDIGKHPTTTKILGFTLFGKFDSSMDKSAAMNSPSVICPSKAETFDDSHKNGLLDINCPYDPAMSEIGNDKNANFVEKQGEIEVESSKLFIDLNSCVSDDDEALLRPCKSYHNVKKLEIDLEAPIAPESQENILDEESPQDMLHITSMQPSKQKAECTQDEGVTLAAEAIVAISSYIYSNQSEKETSNPSNDGLMDPLRWFVDVISSCTNYNEMGKHRDNKNESSSNGLDYFESMTLKLTEENIDEYYLSEFRVTQKPKDEETGSNLLKNRRKGQARRGRQKRDFQRDILPVITSLSRHEVREDLHTFEGLVKATSVTWHSSLTRRATAKNGYGRGRWRTTAATVVIPSPVCSPVIPKVNNIEMGLEDRSLTGWGKTTRRPRRQRGPAGNPPPTIPIT